MAQVTQISYGKLLRQNPGVRRLWFAQLVSELGDWLNLVALLQIINKFSQSAQAEGLLIILQMMPMVVLSPFAGMVADRFDRRKVMIATDLLRAGIVLGFLTINSAGQLWLLYLLSAMQFSLTAFFEPARSAILPRLADGAELTTANALSSVTWSVMLAVGGALGGLISGLFSPQVAFIVDAGSFLLSAWLLVGLFRFENLQQQPEPPGLSEHSAVHQIDSTSFWPVLRYIFRYPRLLSVILVKSGICATAGGVWLLSIIYGQQIFPLGQQGSISVGLLYGAHGLGALFGASLTSRFFHSGSLNPLKGILAAFFFRAIFFSLWGLATNLWLAALAIMSVTACGSLLWVMSTTLLQRLSQDRIRGRLFAIENGALTLFMALSIALTGRALDHWHITPAQANYVTALIALVIFFAWLIVLSRWEKWQQPQ